MADRSTSILPWRRRSPEAAAADALAVFASSRRVDLRKRSVAEAGAAVKQKWQERAWTVYDEVGEIGYGIGQHAGAVSKIRLVAAEMPEDPDAPPEPTKNAAAIAVLNRLQGPEGDRSEIQRVMDLNWQVAGECYLIGRDDEEEGGEVWEARSIDELKRVDDRWRLLDEPWKGSPTQGKVLPPDTFVIRCWKRHGRFANLADSHLRRVLGNAEELLLVGQILRILERSRANAGITVFPSEMEFPVKPEHANLPGAKDKGRAEFFQDFADAMANPLWDEMDEGGLVPAFLFGKGEMLQYIKHISLGRDADQLLLDREKDLISRVLSGLNFPKEVVEGLGKSTHWSAWFVDDDMFKAHVEPDVVGMCDAITTGFFRPYLVDGGMSREEARKFRVWYDASALVVRPNRFKDALEMYDREELTGDALRREGNFDDGDKPEPDELERRRERDRSKAPQIGLPRTQEDDKAPPADDEGDGENAARKPIVAAAAFAASNTDGRKLGRSFMLIDRNLRIQVAAAASGQLRRALERAGAKLMSAAQGNKALRSAVSTVPRILVARTLGPSLVAELGFTPEALADGAFDAFAEDWKDWVAQAQADALGLVPGDARPVYAGRQATDLEDAWAWTRTALERLAADRMFDPDVAAPEVGELPSAGRVPHSIVRESVARAGGAEGLTSYGSAGIAIDAGTKPAGGIGTGQLIREALTAEGVGQEAYVWDYGAFPRSRPLQAHLDLDTQEFVHWDDDVLTNLEDFPDTQWLMPGDHEGCFVAGTSVLSPGLRSSMERTYSGELVEMVTASGKHLSVTPNHPILTTEGWVAAGLLHEGSYVVRSLDPQGVAGFVDPHDAQEPSLIEYVARSLGERSGVLSASVKTAPEDFHGDGVGSKVHVVRSNGLLSDSFDPSLRKHLSKVRFQRGRLADLLASESASDPGFDTVRDAALGSVGRRGHRLPLLGGSPFVDGELRGRQSPPIDTSGDQALLDRVAIDPEVVRQRLLGLATDVAVDDLLEGQGCGLLSADRVVGVRRRPFAGQVFNLHTVSNWYMAEGIIVHNCVCDFFPILTIPTPGA